MKYYQIDDTFYHLCKTYLIFYNISGNMCQYVGNHFTFDLATGKK